MLSHKDIVPLGDRVMIEPKEQAEKTKGGIIIPEAAKKVQTEGTILGVGAGCISVQEGDKVLFHPGSTLPIEVDGLKVMMMREADVMAVINGKSN